MPNPTWQETSALSEATACSVWGNLLGETLFQFDTGVIRGHFDFPQASQQFVVLPFSYKLQWETNSTTINSPENLSPETGDKSLPG
jgi:hypothetical protein